MKKVSVINYKSLADVEIISPGTFTVFVGPNSSGKSNLFEALDFLSHCNKASVIDSERIFGGLSSFGNREWLLNPNVKSINEVNEDFFEHARKRDKGFLEITLDLGSGIEPLVLFYIQPNEYPRYIPEKEVYWGAYYNLIGIRTNPFYEKHYPIATVQKIESAVFKQFVENFSRIFIGNKEVEKTSYPDDKKLSTSCGNLEKVLKRILKDETKREEIIEWMQLFVPGFENIEIKSAELSGSDNLLVYEKGSDKPFNRKLISDGTFNIIALLTAVFQSDEPQFLCIEEPENGLNPKVVRELVGFFREQCKKKGHYIWLNTHSQTLVRELTTDEIILVDKINGKTQIKQIQGENLHGLPMDEALLTNAIGGGIPW